MKPTLAIPLASSLLVLISAAMPAQVMSGIYTVAPTGGNFATFDAAAQALATNGINGPVEIVGQPGTYAGNWTISPIPGASAINTVTFRSSVTTVNQLKCKLTSTAGELITINGGVSYLTIDGFSFEQTAGVAINMLYASPSYSQFLKVQNCVFQPGVTPPSNYGAIRTQSVRNWELLDNEFHIAATALYSQGSWDMYIAGNHFETQSSPYCLSLWNSNRYRCLVYNNLFTGTVTTECVRVDLSHYGTDFFHNTFNLTMPSGWVIDNSACCSVWNRFFNNIFVVRGGGKGIRHRANQAIETNNNIFFIQSGVIGDFGTGDLNSLAAWGTALGTFAQNGNNDNNSIVGDPLFAGASEWELTPASPAIGAAVPVPATWTVGFEVMRDRRGYLRGSKKDIGAFEIAGCKEYGAGCAGTGNLVPALGCSGNVGPGDTVNLDLTDAKVSSQVFTAVGLQQLSFGFGGGCDLLVNPLVTFSTMTTANGTFTLPVPIPGSAAILGLSVYVQMGVVDAAAAGINIAFSNGLELLL